MLVAANQTIQIFNKIKQALGINSDKTLAELMQIPVRRMQTWKHRDSIPYREIIALCIQQHLDLNTIFTIEKDRAFTAADQTLSDRKTRETGLPTLCPHSKCIRPPIGTLAHHNISNSQIVDNLHINAEWAHYALGITPDKLAVIRVVGNNMAPWVADGDLVVIDPTNTAIVSDAPYALLYDNSVIIIKRLVRHNDGQIVAKSDSQYCEDEHFLPDSTPPPRIIGRVLRRLVR